MTQSQLFAHSHGDGRGIGHIGAWSRDGQGIAVLLRHHRAGDALHAVVGDLLDAGLAVLGLAAAHGAEGSLDGVQQGVVAVQDRQSALLEILKNLALGL